MNDSERVWVPVEAPQAELDALRREFPTVQFLDVPEPDEPQLAGVVAAFISKPLPAGLVQRMPRLRWLHLDSGGAAQFITPTIVSRPVKLTTSTGSHGAPFSEFAMACILSLAKRLPECWQATRDRRWDDSIEPELVEGKTVGIVGLGSIGSALAEKAKALGMRVVANKRQVDAIPPYVDQLGGPEFLPELLAESDFVVLCLPSATKDVLGEAELRVMKPSAFLINLTSRRAMAGEAVLVRALREGWIAAAVLNTPIGEQGTFPPDSELWGMPNVIVTARIAGKGDEGARVAKAMALFKENLGRFLNDQPLRNLVDPKRGY